MSAAGTSPDRLTRDSVLAAALVLIDEEGTGGLTMRRLADRLGVVPMALYRHVANKDDLVTAVIDVTVSLVPIPPPELNWRTGLHQLAHGIRATMLEHPGIVGPLVTRPALGPHSLIIGEYGLAVMRNAGFATEDADRGPRTVLTYTIGFVALEVPRLQQWERTPDGFDVDFDGLPADRFPHTIEVRPRPEELVSDTQFDYGLQQILDGIARRAPTNRRNGSPDG